MSALTVPNDRPNSNIVLNWKTRLTILSEETVALSIRLILYHLSCQAALLN